MPQATKPTPSGKAGSQGTAEQAKEKVQDAAEQLQHQAGAKAQQLTSQAGSRIRTELDARSSQAGEQLTSTANAFRRVGQELRKEENDGPARLAEQAADRAERLGHYLSQADGDRILRDLERFARRQPWLVAVGGAAAGFLASRFVKASSTQQNGMSPDSRPALPERASSYAVEGSSGGGAGQ